MNFTFLDGKDVGQIFSYSFTAMTAGVGSSVGINLIGGNFMDNDRDLSADDYLGILILTQLIFLVVVCHIFGVTT